MNKDKVYSSIENAVSLIDCNNVKGCPVAIDFAMDYYVSKIKENNAYKVCYLSSTLIEVGRIDCRDREVLNNIRVWQCLGLSNFYQTLLRIENSGKIPNCMIIQDFDEACNISYFENHNLTIKLMHNIFRIVRKLSQYQDMTCIVSKCFFFLPILN